MTYHHGNLREALLEAATTLLAEHGPQKLSLRAAARQAGVSQSAPYRHFSEKDEMLAAVGQGGFKRLKEELERRLDGVSDHRDQLHAVGWGYVDFARRNPNLFRLMFGPIMTREHEYPDLGVHCRECFEVLLSVIAEGQAAGVFREGDPEVLGTAAWSMVHGVAHLALDGQLPPPFGENRDSLEDTVRALGGIMVEGMLRQVATAGTATPR